MAFYLGFYLLLFLVLENTHYIEAYSETIGCKGSDAVIDFQHNLAKRPIKTEWFFKSAINVTTQIANQMLSNAPMFNPLYKPRAFIHHKRLFIGQISTEDNGIYTRKVIYESDDRNNKNEYTDDVKMTVIQPPSSMPIVRREITKSGRLRLICKSPTFLGYPEVKVVIKDSADNIQGAFSLTVNDTEYRCCLIGEATTCMKENARCVTYELTINKLEEIKSDSTNDCNLTIKCLHCIVIPWLFTIVIIKATGLIILFTTKRFVLEVQDFKNSFQELVCNPRTLFEVFLSLLIMVIIMILFCGNQKNCTVPDGIFIVFGVGSALLLLIPKVASIKSTRDQRQTDQKEEEYSLHDVSKESILTRL